MIPNGKWCKHLKTLVIWAKPKGCKTESEGQCPGWHYLAVKKLLPLLKEITSKNNRNFYCLNWLHSFRKLNCIKEYVKNNDFCNVIMPSEHSKVLEFNQYQKSDKVSFTVYADFEYIIEKIDACKNSPENSSTTKVSQHIPSDFSMSTHVYYIFI